MAIEYDGTTDYRTRRAEQDCKKQTAYCIVSLAVFIVAMTLNDPNVVAALPGGSLTVALIGVGIFIAVILLCKWQMS